jgi:PAS domain S-box-containing protein
MDQSPVEVELAATSMAFQDESAIQVIAHDITAQKRAAIALRESEARKSAILATSIDAIVSIDHEGLVLEWNAAAERLFGFTRVEVLGRRLDNLIVPAPLQDKYLSGLMDYLMTGVGSLIGRPIEMVARRINGEQIPIELAIAQVHPSEPPIFTAFMRDITDRKRAEDALLKSEARKAAVVETALDAIISIDHDERIIEWNPAAEKIFGYSRELALGRNLPELIMPPGDLEKYHQNWPRYVALNRGRTGGQRIEITAQRANGAEFPIEFAVMRIPGEEPPAYTAYIRDIAERKRSEEDLRQSEERLRLLVEDVKDYAIYMLDPHGRVITWNVGAERTEGYRAQEILGRAFTRFYTPEDVEHGKPEQTLAVAKTEGRFQEERWRVRKDGSRYWANIVVTALRDEKGNLYGFAKIAHDMTKYKEAEEATRRLTENLEHRVEERTVELQRAYSELEAFSYSVSHDLRAPLLHIGGFVEILQKEIGPQLTKKHRHYLNTISEATRRLGRMIDDLLAFAHMSRSEIHKIRVNLGEIVREVQRDPLTDQNRRVRWTIHELPHVAGDPILLRQVFFNLITNALKYTRQREEAQIEIGTQPAKNEIVVFVRDNGVGFDMKYADKLFGVFQRLHSATEFEGNGIGLANVRRIVQRHGGRTWAEGEVNGGATFYFSLPQETKGGAA